MNEEWRKITAFHEVSDQGRVRSLKKSRRLLETPRILKQYIAGGRNPYARVFIGKRIFYVHQLVCFAWHGSKRSRYHVVRHLDGNHTNNSPSNLRWGTRLENVQDAIRHGTHVGTGNWHRDINPL